MNSIPSYTPTAQHDELHLYTSYTPTAQLRMINRLILFSCCEVSWAPSASWENQIVMLGLVCERMGLVSEANALEPKLWSQKFWIQILNTFHSNCTDVGDPGTSWRFSSSLPLRNRWILHCCKESQMFFEEWLANRELERRWFFFQVILNYGH